MSDREAALEAWVRKEQAVLWSVLSSSIREAINGVWSIAAESAVLRIVEAARLVGPVRAGEVSWPLVASGVFARVLTQAGIALPDDHPSTADAWDEWEALMVQHGGTRMECVARFAATQREIEKLDLSA